MKLLLLIISVAVTSITYNTTQAGEDSLIDAYHSYWRTEYLKKSQRVPGGMFVDYQKKGTTCSEAIGYGMLISALSNSNHERAKQDFDSLNQFQNSFRSNIDSRLMAWRIDDNSKEKVETACATDGDMDIAYSLILASKKWDDSSYLLQARKIILAIEESLVRKDFSLRRGDWDKQQHSVRLSDFMPVNFQEFARISKSEIWNKVIETQYEIIEQTTSEPGVFPDFVIKKNGKWMPSPPNFLESKHDGMMYYNSCRVPWRLSWAALELDEKRSKNLLDKFNRGVGKVGNLNFKAGYQLNGKAINTWTDGSFTVPHMCSLKVNGRIAEYRKAINHQLTQKESYYPDTIRMLAFYTCK